MFETCCSREKTLKRSRGKAGATGVLFDSNGSEKLPLSWEMVHATNNRAWSLSLSMGL
jgi:hypothetical protein